MLGNQQVIEYTNNKKKKKENDYAVRRLNESSLSKWCFCSPTSAIYCQMEQHFFFFINFLLPMFCNALLYYNFFSNLGGLIFYEIFF